MKKGQPGTPEGRITSKSGSGRKPDALREQAKRRLSDRSTPTRLQDAQKVLHELEVHQIGLEMQNEALYQAQATLTASQERYTDLYDFAPIGYFTFDHMGLIAEVNLTGAALLGVARGELSKKPFSLFVAAPFRDTFHQHCRDVLRKGTAGTCELQLTRKDGTSFYASVHSVPVRDPEGSPTSVRSAIGDISERKHAEETQRLLAAVQEEKDRLSALVNSIQDEIWFADTQKRFMLANRSAIREFSLDPGNGIDVERLAASLEVYRPDGSPRPVDEAPPLRALQGEVVRNQEEMIRTPGSGQLRYRQVSSAPVRDQSGAVIGSVSVVRDITERKRSEEELQRSMERLDIISSTASQLLMSKEPQKVVENLCRRVMEHLDCHAFFNFLVDEELNCLRLNAYAGIPEETAREIHFLDFGVAVCGCAARDACRIVAENIPTTPDIRTELVRAFGIKAYACHPLFAQGRVIGTLSFGTKSRLTFTNDELSLMKTVADQVATAMERIQLLRGAEERADELESRVQQRTKELQQAYDQLRKETREREQLEERLRQSQKMEAIGTLAGGIAHDFNNVLAAMIGFSEMAADDVPVGSKTQRHLKRVREAGLRARELVKQILAFSRKSEGERKQISLTPLVHETHGLLRSSLPTTIQMPLAITTGDDYVCADPTQLQQVLMNLATNAAHAMQDGGQLTIGVSSVTFPPESLLPDPDMKPGTYVKLTLKDTGTGMTEEVRQRIFEPFFTTKEQGKGTGMGLAVVYGIVKSHGGAVTVQSEVGQGSTFEVFLPRAEKPEVKKEEETASTLPTGTERILFVDDEELLVEMARKMVESLGYRVTVAKHPTEAWNLFLEDPSQFDLVITDQTMPDTTGVTLAQKILRVRTEMPIILCTGYSELVSADEAKEVGIREFVMKPVVKKELAEIIRKVLDGRNIGV